MDPQSVAFHPVNDLWKVQNELQRVQAVQAEHSERLLRIERKQDDDTRMKSVWAGSPFPNVLSGTPSHTPLHRPTTDAFKDFDEESTNLIGSLHLDADEEPRRIGATSRANSVRFDESANQGHWSHTSRSSMDLIRAGGVPMSERVSSHKSEGRASSVHSVRSVASGRANSLNMDTGFSYGDSNRSPVGTPALAPGLLLLGSVPAIIRCWMSTTFRHDALLYAAVCTGSHRSLIDRRLVSKLGVSGRVITSTSGAQSVMLPVYFPEAIPHPSSTRSGSPAPQLPTLTVTFTVFDAGFPEVNDGRTIQIIIGSDTLRMHSADILFSSNNMSIIDDDRTRLSIPLVRPEDERVFNALRTLADTDTAESPHDAVSELGSNHNVINGLGQSSRSSEDSVTSLGLRLNVEAPKSAVAIPAEAQANTAASDVSDDIPSPPLAKSLRFAQQPQATASPDTSREGETSLKDESRTASSPAIWSNWRRNGPESTPAPSMDYASASKPRESVDRRKESGIKVLRPSKPGSRAMSSASATSASNTPEGRSRYFDEGKRRPSESPLVDQGREWGALRDEASEQTATVAGAGGQARTVNPAGGASAFAWLKTPAGK